MKRKYLVQVFFSGLVALIVFSGFTHSTKKSGGGPPYNANAPGDQTCSGVEGSNACHSGGIPDNSGPGSMTITFSGGTTYVPGQTYVVTVKGTHPTCNRFGFQIVSILDNSLTNAGTVTLTDTARTRAQIPTWGSYQDRNYVMHIINGTYGTGNTNQWSYNWKAPATNVGSITFYSCVLAANNNNINDSGDETYYSSLKIAASPLGVPDVSDALPEFSVYPIPAKDNIHLDFSLDAPTFCKAELIDLNGRLVQLLFEKENSYGMISECV
jgi:hypothetical protein